MFAITCVALSALVLSLPLVRKELWWLAQIVEESHVVGWFVGILLSLVALGGTGLILRSIFTTYYLQRRVPRNRSRTRRTWFDEHRDYTEGDCPELADLQAVVFCAADGLNAHPGRVLAKRCGGVVRRAMGFPDRTRANIILACQRCDAWLRENCPNLRAVDFPYVHARAVVVALTATDAEEKMARALFSPRASRAQLYAHTPHLIPEYEGPLGWFLSYFGFEVSSVQNFQ